MNQIIEQHNAKFDQIIEHLKTELKELHIGRAQPSLVENVKIESYGTQTPLQQLGSITVSDARSLVIQIWDKSILKNVEKALIDSPIEMSVNVDGELIRINLPALTEERRQQLTKVLHQRLEQAKIAVRNLRDEVRDEIMQKFRDKELTEDDKYRLFEELDKFTGEYNDKIKEIGENKEKEIITV
ncbi:MAG: ribosome recycling factor [Patescibacteria group bacterium]|jgi:ribosome recycling factor|nr:ribosome recycling factor [Patescibacteria group bacterium]